MRRLIPAICALSCFAQTNPYTLADKEALAKGKQLYGYYCVFCHGMDGVSGRGAQLASAYRKHGATDREMFRVIADGVPGTEMSGHWIEEDEIWKILLFVRQFEQNATAKNCATGEGDATKGETLFASSCRNCHNPASRLGPDLTGIGATHAREHLRESIAEPNKAISRTFRTARLTTARGETVRGLLLSQDEYTVHVLDLREQIRSYPRTDLKDVAFPKESIMPSFARLGESGINDLLAYLCGGKR